jgi:ferredoxin-NADP reductase
MYRRCGLGDSAHPERPHPDRREQRQVDEEERGEGRRAVATNRGKPMLYSSRLVHREEVACATIAIRAARPPDFAFCAGAYVDLMVPDLAEDDSEGPSRGLSITSPPGASYLEFILRLRDTPYKRALASMPLGAPLLIEGPYDDLKLDPRTGRALIFIAGGIGIAPFLSVLREAAEAKRALNATLFYSNRRPEDTVALEELDRMQSEIPGFRLVATMTRMAASEHVWTGETEHLGLDFFRRYLPALVGPLYYISGAPTLIAELRMALRTAGVPEKDLRIELFTGY